ncbi:MAG: hypothetical protein U0Z26_13270 [Anaerolineales bacterium]
MNIKTLIQTVKNKLNPQPNLEDEVVLRFLQVLENVRHEEMSCAEMYTQLDQFVERELKSHDAAKIMPLIQEHIDMCPECCDEYEALLTLVENTK